MEPNLHQLVTWTNETPNENSECSNSCCNRSNYSNYSIYELDTKHQREITLDLSLNNKCDTIFESDQTPTPTRLIKNCDEVGLFEDLRHVNPFDEGFRRAVEQQKGQTPTGTITSTLSTQNDGESLHTPQVYPLEVSSGNEYCTSKAIDSASPLDVPIVEQITTTNANSTSNQYVANEETPLMTVSIPPEPPPVLAQIIQPQIMTWLVPAQAATIKSTNPVTTIPVQTVRPFLLPKPNTVTTTSTATTSQTSTASSSKLTTRSKTKAPPLKLSTQRSQPVQNEPSSASLTPTSQLPIKERLKAILSNSNNKMLNSFDTSPTKAKKLKPTNNRRFQRDEDCMERRRAAATRYRNKMRNEHKDLQQRNAQLQNENKSLKQRIYQLEQELNQTRQSAASTTVNSSTHAIHIPPSSIHLVINVPKMVLPANEQQVLTPQKP